RGPERARAASRKAPWPGTSSLSHVWTSSGLFVRTISQEMPRSKAARASARSTLRRLPMPRSSSAIRGTSEAPFRRRHTEHAWIHARRAHQRLGKRLERDLDDVVQVLPLELSHVEVAERRTGERLEEDRHELHVERAHLRLRQVQAGDEIRAAREIERACD